VRSALIVRDRLLTSAVGIQWRCWTGALAGRRTLITAVAGRSV
jgi:hypothetical protein